MNRNLIIALMGVLTLTSFAGCAAGSSGAHNLDACIQPGWMCDSYGFEQRWVRASSN